MTPLEGIRVVEVGWGFAGALASLILADYGAEVIVVEPPGGSVLRPEPAFPLWFRGKKSVVLDLKDAGERSAAQRLVETSDVLLTSLRPGVAQGFGLVGEVMEERNPGLIHALITGFGTHGPYAHLAGYEGIVLAKMGAMAHVAGMAPRAGPAFPAVPYASFGAAHAAVQGILAALHVRAQTGLGQRVETSLVQGLAAHDPWEWFLRILCRRYPDAYTPAPPYSARGVPNTSFAFRLLVAPTRDGKWLQFSQTSPHLFREFMEALGLGWMWDDPEWRDAPDFDSEEKRERFWEILLDAVRGRTFAEWAEEFRRRPNVWAEPFRTTRELLDHPQIRHDRRVLTVDAPGIGPTRQLAPFVSMSKTPARPPAPAPTLGEHNAEVLEGAPRPTTLIAHRSSLIADQSPLAGVTVLELGLWYAAPYGGALLADLGARVIKIEPLHGEPMRHVMPVPDAGAIKVLQGKQSVVFDLGRPEGRELLYRIVRRVDLVLASYRGGVAERLGVDYESLRQHNPDVVYLGAPGYGADGPCARKPAFAPTIGAAVGAGRLQGGPSISEQPNLSLAEIKRTSLRLNWAAQAPGNADGCSALGVATALLLGLIARQRHGVGQEMRTSMLGTTAYALSDDCIDHPTRLPRREPDPMLYGLGSFYRLYETAEGWIFLACPRVSERERLRQVLEREAELETAAWASDAVDEKRALALASIFRRRPARDWEALLTARGVACVEVTDGPVSRAVFEDRIARDAGFLTAVEHPSFGSHDRLAPLVSLSLNPGRPAPAPLLGADTEAVLREIGVDAETISRLEEMGVILCEPPHSARRA